MTAHVVWDRHQLFHEFDVPAAAFTNFMESLEEGYLRSSPYHNSVHAADVLHSLHCLLLGGLVEVAGLSKLEVFAALLAAAMHDFRHPGRTNAFLVNGSHALALTYNDQSVLESLHTAEAFKLMGHEGMRLLDRVELEERRALRKQVIGMVLATDMTKHNRHLEEFQKHVLNGPAWNCAACNATVRHTTPLGSGMRCGIWHDVVGSCMMWWDLA